MAAHRNAPAAAPRRAELHRVIFEAETPAGKAFDVTLIAAILLSILVVLLDSVEAWHARLGRALWAAEWAFTLLFTVEYVLRLLAVRHPWRYARSFLGVVDLLAVLPTYLSVLFPGAESLLVIRGLRLLRVFRVFKLGHFLREANVLLVALRSSAPKIIVFLGTVLTLVTIIGAAMYLIEGEENGFTSIPRGIYWAIVTLTTVGYGDIAPRTVPGQVLASAVMIMGYSILAVPTGIVSVELAEAQRSRVTTRACPDCGGEGHASDARFCKHCGAALE